MSTLNDRFKKVFMAVTFTLKVFARNLPNESRKKKYFFIFRLLELPELEFEPQTLG